MSITGSIAYSPDTLGHYIQWRPQYEFYNFPTGFPTLQTGSAPPAPTGSVPIVGQLWPRGNFSN